MLAGYAAANIAWKGQFLSDGSACTVSGTAMMSLWVAGQAEAQSGDRVRVSLEPPGVDEVVGARAGATTLRPPTGQLPAVVRGREELLGRLRALVEMPDRRVHVLSGLGGSGKSTVAPSIADEQHGRGRAAWWVPAGDPATITSALLGLALELGAPPGEVSAALAGRRSPADLLWRFLEARKGWLLVFDNVDDLDALAVGGTTADSGAGWLRPCNSGLILVTSRVGDPRAWGRHAELHAVGWLDRSLALRRWLTWLLPPAR
jgi:hypothetical protein